VVFGSGFAAAKHLKTLSSNVDGYYAHFCEIHPSEGHQSLDDVYRDIIIGCRDRSFRITFHMILKLTQIDFVTYFRKARYLQDAK
jgi:hypothetical protein